MDARDSHPNVQITDRSLARAWVARYAAQIGRPLSAIQEGARPVHLFVEDELLVDRNDPAALRLLTERYEAEVLPPPAVPAQPRGMDPDRQRSVEGMPETVRVRVRGERVSLATLEVPSEELSGDRVRVTSRAGAGTLALAQLLAREGRHVMLNSIAQPDALPLSWSTEGPRPGDTSDAYRWPEFAGPSSISRAWQLVDAYAQVRSLQTIFIGILDGGFYLDQTGQPLAPMGQSPDVTFFVQWNLINEGTPAGGPGPVSGKEWHGNGVLSAAAAPIGNYAGAAGAAGVRGPNGVPRVIPVLFKFFGTISDIFRCLQLSVAWGVDVINMSFSIEFPKILLPISANWDPAFQFAADQGIVVVASAGNHGAELPGKILFPATRTPGTITVGALDANGTASLSNSNYGSSVDIWAPGTNIHVMPDPQFPNGSRKSGTSCAAAIVAGAAALMKAVQTTLNTGDVKRILRETGHTTSPDPKVLAHLNAYAALLRVMGDRLPDGTIEEPNNTPQTARQLFPGIFPHLASELTPIGRTTLSRGTDRDWYQFAVTQYSSCIIMLDYLRGLSQAVIELLPDDPFSRVLSDVIEQFPTPSRRWLVCRVISPGNYRVLVKGHAPNIYELKVQLHPKPLEPDMFEQNDTMNNAARFTMRTQYDPTLDPTPFPLFRPGTYEANIHVPADVDFFRIIDIKTKALSQSIFRIDSSDAPVDAVLFGPDGLQIEQFHAVRDVRFVLRAPESFVRVSSPTLNRYSLTLQEEVNEDLLPGPLQKERVLPDLHWWPDPPFRLDKWERFFQIEVTEDLKEVGSLRLVGTPGLTLELLSQQGEMVVSGVEVEAGVPHAVDIDLSGVAPGTHILRVGRTLRPGQRFSRRLANAMATFTIGPAF